MIFVIYLHNIWTMWRISRQECSMHVTRKLCINLEVPSFLNGTLSPRCLQSLRGHAWFLTVVNGVFYVRNTECMSPESSALIFKSLASIEVSEFSPTVKDCFLIGWYMGNNGLWLVHHWWCQRQFPQFIFWTKKCEIKTKSWQKS